ncbi:putative dynein light chain [Trypanosoma cruzi]|uniref:Dynein light chain n=1 Tax=Trypanosoma cruzi (strain CL Brener) TaxID=353153 RepID=Q4E1Q6_TRYCC|nr:dynein light chain, putative [Trypanosoma cruzi]EAN98686.1 dynein light chain, putative [Trypanosoma cruzi]KAF8298396.1 putative dynein light chain [Trypanosoma cruzi]|eukprot:XP_820537.1 dynein light chain [Trypanosoma cruzi strain CL Brener]
MSDRKPNVKFADISEEMQNDAMTVATKAIKEHQMEKDIAAHIKKEFDKRYNPTWQCIAGRSFAADVVHESKHLIYFYIGQMSILLWKTG